MLSDWEQRIEEVSVHRERSWSVKVKLLQCWISTLPLINWTNDFPCLGLSS